MGFSMPPHSVPALQGDNAQVGKDWYVFLRKIWEHIGAGGANHPVYADVSVPAMGLHSGYFAEPDFAQLYSGSILAAHFDPDAIEGLQGHLVLPVSYIPGTEIVPYIHWAPTDSNAGTVVWALEYSWANSGMPAEEPIILPRSSTALEEAYHVTETTFAPISGSGKNAGSAMLFSICRASTDSSDTYADDVVLLRVGLRIVVGGIGVTQRFI